MIYTLKVTKLYGGSGLDEHQDVVGKAVLFPVGCVVRLVAEGNQGKLLVQMVGKEAYVWVHPDEIEQFGLELSIKTEYMGEEGYEDYGDGVYFDTLPSGTRFRYCSRFDPRVRYFGVFLKTGERTARNESTGETVTIGNFLVYEA